MIDRVFSLNRLEPSAGSDVAGEHAGLVVRPAPAKINLALHVMGRRGDGYHLLESLVVFTELGDRISAKSAQTDRFGITGPFASELPDDRDNLVTKARDALRQHLSLGDMPPASIALEKNLPVASGIGGGSSDAAATLHVLCLLWKLNPAIANVSQIGTTLGADVPMCLCGEPLVARGIGEKIEPLLRFPALAMVLVNPGIALSTAEIFARIQDPGSEPLPGFQARPDFRDLCALLATVRNDLQAPAIQSAPQVATALDALTGSGAALSRMSGSGATCFGLFSSQAAADKAATAISAKHPDWFVEATNTRPPDHEQT